MRSGPREDALIDPDAELDAASRLLDAGIGFATGLSAEVYLRSSRRIRVSSSGSGAAPTVEHGMERGIAARVVDEGGARSGFAAASGATEDAARWAFRQAAASVFRTAAVVPVIDGNRTLVDRERSGPMPGPNDLSEWLADARSRSRQFGRAVWVEAGLTCESLVNNSGLRTSRLRRRVWSLGVARRWDLPVAPERATIVAAPELSTLPVGRPPEGSMLETATERSPGCPFPQRILLDPHAATSLIRALVLALHGAASVMGVPCGAGWRLRDDPDHPGATSGGSFDDVGAPTAPRILADGRTVVGRLDGPGCLRRSSFRDPPAPGPSHLVVEGDEATVGRGDPVVTDLRVVPTDSGMWTLIADGYTQGPGPTAEVFIGARFRGSSMALPRAVAGTFGPPIRTGEGVTTPGLVLEGVRLEG